MFRKRPPTYRLIAVPDAFGTYEVTVDRMPGLHLRGRNLSDLMMMVRRELAQQTGVPPSQIQLDVDVKAVGGGPAKPSRRQKGDKPRSAA